MITPSQDQMFPALEKLLSHASKRQQALASNIANIDTPGYHAKDYTFESQLGASMTMATTHENHVAPMQDTAGARVYEVGSPEKPNGNDVDIDRELTEITKNGVEYLTLVQYLNQKIRMLRSAISDGGRG
jgi:flagellar basal-body rod protein FlgB